MPTPDDVAENLLAPLQIFNFHVRFKRGWLPLAGSDVNVCSGAFAECTGLEATMEPKVIKVGGANYGTRQLMGRVSFATVVLKRGMTSTRDLWNWFALVGGGAYSYRLSVDIEMRDTSGKPVLTWSLERALPVKFKAANLNARGTELGIEELHLAHEGLRLAEPAG